MPEFFLELFSEEIPAGMQGLGCARLARLVCDALARLNPSSEVKLYEGPRRLAVKLHVASDVPAARVAERGPRIGAPDQALDGFLRKHGATKEQVTQEGNFWVLHKQTPALSARELILEALPKALTQFGWQKSMRWGQSGDFTWVRPLRRIVCLLDWAVVPIQLGPITAGNETEGHRIHGPGPFAVASAATWEERLRQHFVLADQEERQRVIAAGLAEQAAVLGLSVAPDTALLDEVTGLVEWPVPLVGQIGPQFMDLPPEVRELSMKINQKYFALRDQEGNPAPYFAFVANLVAPDDGAAIITGNECVLRARLADARHFWDQDLKTPLDARLPKLEKIIFHARLGTQRQRAERIATLAAQIAGALGADGPTREQAHRAGLLCKADLVTQMVGEFPELQGIMGGYYATRSEGPEVGGAVKTHYQPKGPADAVPAGIVAASVALADKLDTLVQFFAIGETPTGSGDPYALRRAALGVIRIILENGLRLPLKPHLGGDAALFDFIIERLRVKLRGEGKRFDVLEAVLAAGADDDLTRILHRIEAVGKFVDSEAGGNLLTAYRRAANILRIEAGRQAPPATEPVVYRPPLAEEKRLLGALEDVGNGVSADLQGGNYHDAMLWLARLREPVDEFFNKVTVNDPEPETRRNRLRLLAQLRDTMHQIADFSKIEG